jgi:hypothetical protein
MHHDRIRELERAAAWRRSPTAFVGELAVWRDQVADIRAELDRLAKLDLTQRTVPSAADL